MNIHIISEWKQSISYQVINIVTLLSPKGFIHFPPCVFPSVAVIEIQFDDWRNFINIDQIVDSLMKDDKNVKTYDIGLYN